MKNLLALTMFASLTVAAITGCNVQTDNSTAKDAIRYANHPTAKDPNFAAAQSIINTKCASCHAHTEWTGFSEQDFLKEGLVSASDPSSSSIFARLKTNGGNMPKIGSVSEEETATIKTWILGIGASLSTADPLTQRTEKVARILNANCIKCHSKSIKGDYGDVPPLAPPVKAFIADGNVAAFNDFFLNEKLIQKSDPKKSWLYQALAGSGGFGDMPADAPPLSASDLKAINDWIMQFE